jgi:hypothetical protein
VIIVSDSELYESIVQSIKEFSWSNFGMDDVEIGILEDPESQEWIAALAHNIERDWVNYVDGIT